MAEQQKPQPMKEPMKPHGDKISLEKSAGKQPAGGAGEPQATPLEPEKQGGIGGP